MNDISNRNRKAFKIGLLLVVIIGVAAYFWVHSDDTPCVPFAGLKQEALIYDDWLREPNGDGYSMQAYQLAPLNVERWVHSSRDEWIRGPVNDKRYLKAFEWKDRPWDYEQWLASDKFYFYMEDYEEFDKDTVHHSSIWALDSKTYRLYHVSGSM